MTLSVQDLSFLYEKRLTVLEKISFSVEKGEFIGIFGPNGGGKTTLLRLLVGLLTPQSGTIEILGGSPQKVSHRMGYVPQVRHFDKEFPISVMEVVLQGRLAHHKGYLNFSEEDKKIATGALERVGLHEMAKLPFGQLSGGQIQRTLIARALASKPEILLLDEAMAGVDPRAFKEIFDFLITMKGEITILLVTHELQTVAADMDRLLCINREVTTYSPQDVCGHYAMGLYHPPLMKKEEKHD